MCLPPYTPDLCRDTAGHHARRHRLVDGEPAALCRNHGAGPAERTTRSQAECDAESVRKDGAQRRGRKAHTAWRKRNARPRPPQEIEPERQSDKTRRTS